MKDIITALKEARDNCTNTVDESTLEKLNLAIQQLEEIENSKSIDWVGCASKALVLIKLIAKLGE